MTTAKQTLAIGLTAQLDKAVQDKIAQVRAYLDWRRAYGQTYTELSRLTDRELADLGFARADIARISREAANMNGKA